MEKMNTNDKLEKHYNEYFTPNKKLYSKYLKKKRAVATGDKGQYTESDYLKLVGHDYSVTFDAKEKILYIENAIYSVYDHRTNKNVFSTIDYEHLDKMMKRFHNECLINGIQVEYSAKHWKNEPDNYMEMIYPYSLHTESRVLRFDTNNVKVMSNKEFIHFEGDITCEYYESFSVSEKQGYEETKLIKTEIEPNYMITLNNVYMNAKNKKLSRLLRKYRR